MKNAGSRIARQQWRARIETLINTPKKNEQKASPASNGGRGLKQESLMRKLQVQSIARQQWRARIETYSLNYAHCARWGIARQQWRARIETMR